MGSCLVGVLRRIFSPSSLPEFPVRYTIAKAEGFILKEGEFGAEAAIPVPGIVARLMGLETLPRIMKIHGERSAGSVMRSRSVNDPDYGEKFDKDGDPRSSVKSTSSFRETTTYLEIENEEFLVLIFESGTERGDRTSRWKKKRRKRRRNITSILVKTETNSWSENSSIEQNPESAEVSTLAKLRNVERDRQAVVPVDKQAECGSENSSSPVSVLESGKFVTSDLDMFPSDECTAEDSNVSHEHGDHNLLHPQSSRCRNAGSQRKEILKQPSSPETQVPSCSWEIMSHYGPWKHEEEASVVDICADMGREISEELIDDLIVQLYPCKSSKN